MLVSIIVPVYNTEKYLDECIQSILNQTYSNFELLLINDGSTDRSGEICDTYALKDKRIKVFHQENAGVSAARNLGLDHATGNWVTFVDSDDYVGENYLKYFIDESIGCQIIYGGIIRFKDQNFKNLYEFHDQKINFSQFIESKIITSLGYVGSKFFKKNIIEENKIKFNININFAEDSLFVLEYLKYVESILLSKSTEYYYRDSSSSLVKKIYSFEKELYILDKAKFLIQSIILHKKIDINKQLVIKELQYYLDRVKISNSIISEKSLRFKNLDTLYKNYKEDLLYKYKDAKGRGRLIYFLIAINNKSIIDFINRKFKIC